MDPGLNVSYITLDGHVELHKYRCLYFVVMFAAYLLIICCNSVIVCLVVIHKSLHEPMYIFIAALLLNSVLLSTNIYPKLLLDFLSDAQRISYSACLLQCFVFYSLNGSEFLLLAAMSYDRYVSICQPLLYPSVMRRSSVAMLLLLAWLLPAGQVAVPVSLNAKNRLCSFSLKGIFCNNSINHLYCDVSPALSVYGVIVLLNLLFLPMLFILFTYTKILVITYRRGRDARRKAAHTCLPHLLVLINYSCLVTFDIIVIRQVSDFPQTARLIMTLQVIFYHPLFNPIIYGLKVKEVSKHIRRLFCLTR